MKWKLWTGDHYIHFCLQNTLCENVTFICTSSRNKWKSESLGPKLKISLFPLTRPTLLNSVDWIFFIGNLSSLKFFLCFAQNSSYWKFRILDSFRQKIDIFALPSTSLSSKKSKSLPTHFQNCGSGKGKQKYFWLWPKISWNISSKLEYEPLL